MGFFDNPTGLMSFSLIASAVAAVPISRGLLARYRSRIHSLMRQTEGPIREEPVARPGPLSSLELEQSPNLRRRFLLAEGAVGRRQAFVYGIAGVAWAMLATVLTLRLNSIQPSLGRLLAFAGVFLWPCGSLVARVAGWGRRAEIITPFAVLAGSLFAGVLIGGGVAAATLTAWAITMLPPAATVLLVSWLGVRSIGPLVTGFLGAWLLVIYAGLASVASLGVAPNTIVGLLLGAALAGAIYAGQGVARWIARLYEQKKVSDTMLWADVWMATFTGWLCIWLSIPGTTPSAKWFGVLAGVVPFAAYRAVVTVALRAMAAGEQGPRLLLLRVFGERARSTGLLDSVGWRWRRRGSIQLIAAPDVAATTLDPDELLEFVAGRLDRAFIKTPEDLQARVAEVDPARDPDGSHRITEFFCQGDAWRATLRRLAREADAVLMDLRGFGPENAGCIYELGQLVNLVATKRTVLIVDETSDQGFLKKILQEEWSKLRADSPNRTSESATIRVVDLGTRCGDPATSILGALEKAASACLQPA